MDTKSTKICSCSNSRAFSPVSLLYRTLLREYRALWREYRALLLTPSVKRSRFLQIGLQCRRFLSNIGLFCGNIGLFHGYTRLCCGDITPYLRSTWLVCPASLSLVCPDVALGRYGVATISRLLEIIVLLRRISSLS